MISPCSNYVVMSESPLLSINMTPRPEMGGCEVVYVCDDLVNARAAADRFAIDNNKSVTIFEAKMVIAPPAKVTNVVWGGS